MKRTVLIVITLLMCSANSLFAQKQIHILSVNDMHATIEKMPRLAWVVDSLRKIDPELIVLAAGDNRTGNPYNDRNAEVSRPMTELMNAVGFTASAIGNHEFDGGVSGFRTQINRSNFPYICANISIPDSMRTHVYPYKFFIANGVKVGILGGIQVNSRGIPDCHPNQVGGISFREVDEVIPDYQWMRQQCDVLLLISHDGYEADSITATKYPFFDVIVGGHTHTKIDGGKMVNGVMITQAKNKLNYATLTTMTVLDGKVSSKSARLLDLSSSKNIKTDVKDLLDTFYDNPILSEVLTQVKSPITSTEELGNMEMDALIAEIGADIAVQNGGGVRFSSFSPGPFTLANLLSLDPFANDAIIFEMTGKEIADFIMNDYDMDEKQTPYVGGIKYVMKVDKTTKHPKSIKITMLNGTKFSEKATYKMVANSYATSISTSEKRDSGTNLQAACSDFVEAWLRKQPSIDYSGSSRATIIYE